AHSPGLEVQIPPPTALGLDRYPFSATRSRTATNGDKEVLRYDDACYEEGISVGRHKRGGYYAIGSGVAACCSTFGVVRVLGKNSNGGIVDATIIIYHDRAEGLIAVSLNRVVHGFVYIFNPSEFLLTRLTDVILSPLGE
ncbi:hypothetical protein AAF712_003998, partial [Marasmius tenuissimus]